MTPGQEMNQTNNVDYKRSIFIRNSILNTELKNYLLNKTEIINERLSCMFMSCDHIHGNLKKTISGIN